MNIRDFLQPENVSLDMVALSKTRLLQAISEKAGTATGISGKTIFSALHNREKLGSTGVGDGIAIPHASVAGIGAPFGMLFRLGSTVDFDSIDGMPVDIVVLLLTPPESRTVYLHVLANIAKRLRMPDTVKVIRSATEAGAVYAAISRDDV